MVQQILKLVRAQLLISHEVEQNARIEIAGAGAHRDAARGREPHGCVDGPSVAQSAEAGSVSEVRENSSLRKPRAQPTHQRLVGKAVETVASNSYVEIGLRNRQMRCQFRHGSMKSIVETGVVRRRRKNRLRFSDKRKRL